MSSSSLAVNVNAPLITLALPRSIELADKLMEPPSIGTPLSSVTDPVIVKVGLVILLLLMVTNELLTNPLTLI
ncbi:MAG: hypothetical protein A4E27_01147 [Methanobacterium sp. PtaU1.Bin242]|nr:MAG: hypothetical protein A4E27_01147 [Methanobacterium sp. PtaU1.Bin242]